jgi:hypothetical protein
MKMSVCLIAASLFANLNASSMSVEPPKDDNASYFLNCRDVTGEIYAELLFLQPNGSSLYYAAQATPLDQSINGGTADQAVSPNWKIFELSPNYTPAFKIGGKILFTPGRTNLEASWERLYSSKKASKTLSPTADGGTLMIGPLFDIGPNSAAYTKAHGVVHFQFDAVDLVFGQQFCAFTRWYPNLFVGAGFVRIKQALKSTYSNVAGDSVRSFDASSVFTGAGPKLGLNFDYRIVTDFFFSGASSIGLMIGQSKNSVTYKSNSSFLVTQHIPEPNTQTTEIPNRTQLIPSFEEKLGFSYMHLFKCWKIKFEAGYQAQIYLNAIQTIDMTAPQVIPSFAVDATPDSGLYAVGFERTLSNFIVTGPYLSLNFDF